LINFILFKTFFKEHFQVLTIFKEATTTLKTVVKITNSYTWRADVELIARLSWNNLIIKDSRLVFNSDVTTIRSFAYHCEPDKQADNPGFNRYWLKMT